MVAITLGCALMPVIMPSLLARLPAALQPFVHSSVIIACVVSVFLNLLLNGIPARDEEPELAVTPEHIAEM
ncbi:Uric acid transporter UacT [compost metagenome]